MFPDAAKIQLVKHMCPGIPQITCQPEKSDEAPHPNPPMLAAAVPSPNTLLAGEPMVLLKEGLEPNAADAPNAGVAPKDGGLPNTGALPKPPVRGGGTAG